MITDGSLHVIQYENLTENTIQELAKTLRFLSITFTKNARRCVRNNMEGYYHRTASEDTLYPLLNNTTRQYLSQIYKQVINTVQRKLRNGAFS